MEHISPEQMEDVLKAWRVPEYHLREDLAAIHAKLRRTQWALDFCLRTLKYHHMSRPGIAATVAETERRRDGAPKPCGYCGREHCECSDADVSSEMGAR